MFKRLFSKYGTEIVVLNEIDNPKEIEKEMYASDDSKLWEGDDN